MSFGSQIARQRIGGDLFYRPPLAVRQCAAADQASRSRMRWAELNEGRWLLLLGDEQMSAGQQRRSFSPRPLRVDHARQFRRALPLQGRSTQPPSSHGIDKFDTRRCFLEQQNAADTIGADSLDLGYAWEATSLRASQCFGMPVDWPSSLRDRENQAKFAARSPTATRDMRPFRPRRKQIPETSLSGTSTTRRACSRLFELLRFLDIRASGRQLVVDVFLPFGLPPTPSAPFTPPVTPPTVPPTAPPTAPPTGPAA